MELDRETSMGGFRRDFPSTHRSDLPSLRNRGGGLKPDDSEAAFARVAVERGYVTPEQIEEAILEQARRACGGQRLPLGEILLERGRLGPDQVADVFNRLAPAAVACPKCGLVYEVSGGSDRASVRCLECGDALVMPAHDSPEPSPMPAREAEEIKRLGKYRLIRQVGGGGMGTVYEAEDSTLRRRVALKVLKEGCDDANVVARLHREAAISAQLKHPNIVTIHEVGVEPDASGRPTHFIAMDYVEGRDLAEVMKEGKRRRRDLLKMLAAVARAVAYTHSKKIVHRDLKPGNVLVEEGGRILLTDFGLARAESFTTKLTRTGAVMGTPHYMAPEQVEGRTKEIDARTDVYALGVMMYEMLAGRLPFATDTAAKLYSEILRGEPARPSRVTKGIAADAEVICLKAMERNRAHRYPTALEFAEDLENYLAGRPIQARPASVATKARKWVLRHRALSLLVAAAMLVCVVSALLLWRVAEKDTHLKRKESELTDTQQRLLEQMRSTMGACFDAALDLRRVGNVEGMRKYAARAEEVCRRVIAEVPNLAEPHYRLGRMYRALMQSDRALAEQEEALRKDPANAGARYERAVLNAQRYLRRRAGLSGAPDDEETREMLECLKQDVGELDRLFSRGSVPISAGEVECAKGLLALATKDLSKAQECMMRAMEAEPTLEDTYAVLAELAHALGRYEEAVRWTTVGIERDRGWASHWGVRGLARTKLADSRPKGGEDPSSLWKVAIEDFDEALRLNPEDERHRISRAAARLHWADYKIARDEDPSALLEAAIEDYSEVLRKDPSSQKLRLDRGRAYAVLALSEVARSKDPSAHFEAAIADCDALMERPERDRAQELRSTVYLARGDYKRGRGTGSSEDYQRALQDLTVALGRNPENFAFRRQRGQALLYLSYDRLLRGEDATALLDPAIEDFGEVLKKDPEQEIAWRCRAEAYANLAVCRLRAETDPSASYEAAIGDFDQAVKRNPKSGETWVARGDTFLKWAVFKDGRREDPSKLYSAAIRDFDEGLSRFPDSVEIWVNRGRAHTGLAIYKNNHGQDPSESYEAAILDFDEAEKRDPSRVDTWLNRGGARMNLALYQWNLGRNPGSLLEAALRDLDRAIQIDRRNAMSWVVRGDVRFNMGRWKESRSEIAVGEYQAALADYAEVARLNPGLKPRVSRSMSHCDEYVKSHSRKP